MLIKKLLFYYYIFVDVDHSNPKSIIPNIPLPKINNKFSSRSCTKTTNLSRNLTVCNGLFRDRTTSNQLI